MGCLLVEMGFDVAFGAGLDGKVFDAILPVVKQEREHARFAVLETLFPTEDEFYLTLLAHQGDLTFPEARGIGGGKYGGFFRLRCPTRIDFIARELDQGAAGFFAHGLVGGQFVYGQQYVGGIHIWLSREGFEQG